MRTIPLAALALAALALPALAQDAASPDPAKVQPGRYAVDGGHTQVGFKLSHMGFSNYSGTFSEVTGSLDLPQDRAQARLSVRFPTNSVSTTSAKLTDELKAPDWLDAAKHPEITFVSRKVEPTLPGKAKVTGDLTLHGVTRPVTLDVSFVGGGVNPMSKKANIGFEATGTIRRSEFGVTKYLPLIGDELALTIDAAFVRAD